MWLSAIAAIIALQAALILTHRPWLDEWQAALIVVQSPDFTALFTQLRYEGHPPLWYLMLYGGAWLTGTPEGALLLTNFLYAGAGLAIILRCSPFSRLERLLLLSSEIVLVEYFSISRSLGLGAVLFFWALAAWKSRSVWLPVALLPMCDFLFGVLSIILILFRGRFRRDPRVGLNFAGLGLWLASSIFAAWSVRPAHDVVSDPPYTSLAGLGRFAQQIGMNSLPLQMIEGRIAWNGVPPFLLGIVLAPIFLWLGYRITRKDRLQAAAFFGFLAFLATFTLFVYPLYFRHTSLAALLLIGIIWLRADAGIAPGRMERLWFVMLSVVGIASAATMLWKPFDTARETVTLIRNGHLTDKPWFAYPAYRAITLSGEGRMAIGDLEKGCTSTFRRWDFQTRIETKSQFLQLLRQHVRQSGSFYLMTPFKLDVSEGLVRRIAHVEPGYDDLKYYLWEIGGKAPSRGAALKPCVTGLRDL